MELEIAATRQLTYIIRLAVNQSGRELIYFLDCLLRNLEQQNGFSLEHDLLRTEAAARGLPPHLISAAGRGPGAC